MPNKTYPSWSRFLLCEDARAEQNGKHSILGLFAGDNISLVEKIPKGSEFAVDRICIFIILKGGVGQFKIGAKFIEPNGKAQLRDLVEDAEMVAGQPCCINIRFSPFPMKELGIYSIELMLDDNDSGFKYEFEVKGEFES
ncbi:MAG: DUF6941 family protein [Arenimonas sp.]